MRAIAGPRFSTDGKHLTRLDSVLAMCVGLGLAFQVGHFMEHAVQFGVWVSGKWQWVIDSFCGRDTPFMSWPVTEIVRWMGAFLFPTADLARQMMMGVEVLHLIGNSLFLLTIAGLYCFIPSKCVRCAFYIQSGHLLEHLALTLTAYYVGKPMGISTLFGQSGALWGRELAVGYRVGWHFAMNLFPMSFVIMGMMQFLFPKPASPVTETPV